MGTQSQLEKPQVIPIKPRRGFWKEGSLPGNPAGFTGSQCLPLILPMFIPAGKRPMFSMPPKGPSIPEKQIFQGFFSSAPRCTRSSCCHTTSPHAQDIPTTSSQKGVRIWAQHYKNHGVRVVWVGALRIQFQPPETAPSRCSELRKHRPCFMGCIPPPHTPAAI